MNRDFKILLTEVEDKKKRPHQPVVNMRHWLKDVCRHKSGENSLSLSRIWKMLAGKEQLRIALRFLLVSRAGTILRTHFMAMLMPKLIMKTKNIRVRL